MIIFGNRKASKLEARARNGSPIEWRTIDPRSILEVGCGYGKLLKELRRRLDVPWSASISARPNSIRLVVSWPATQHRACS